MVQFNQILQRFKLYWAKHTPPDAKLFIITGLVIQLTRLHKGRVFSFRIGYLYALHTSPCEAERASLKLKAQTKPCPGFLPLRY